MTDLMIYRVQSALDDIDGAQEIGQGFTVRPIHIDTRCEEVKLAKPLLCKPDTAKNRQANCVASRMRDCNASGRSRSNSFTFSRSIVVE